MESASLSRLAQYPQFAAHEMNQLGRYGEAQAGTAEAAARRTIRLRERLKNCLVPLFRYAAAAVFYRDVYVELFRLFDQHLNPPQLRKLDRVVHQVGNDLADSARVSNHAVRQARIHCEQKIETFLAR